jgi:hypothetical protein
MKIKIDAQGREYRGKGTVPKIAVPLPLFL